MPVKRLPGLVAAIPAILMAGCCSWCQHHCPQTAASPPAACCQPVRPCLLPGPGDVCTCLLSYACELRAATGRAPGTVAAPVPAAGLLPIVGGF